MVFITGGAFTPRAEAFLNGVDNPKVRKPFEVAQLISVVNQMIAAARGKGAG